jgi:hypothetical protein
LAKSLKLAPDNVVSASLISASTPGGLHASTVPPGFPLPHIPGFATFVEYSHDLDEQWDIIVVNRTY